MRSEAAISAGPLLTTPILRLKRKQYSHQCHRQRVGWCGFHIPYQAPLHLQTQKRQESACGFQALLVKVEGAHRIGGRVGKSPGTEWCRSWSSQLWLKEWPACASRFLPPTHILYSTYLSCGHAVLRKESSAVACGGCRSPLTVQVSKKSRRLLSRLVAGR